MIKLFVFGRTIPLHPLLISESNKIIIGLQKISLEKVANTLRLQPEDILVYVRPITFEWGAVKEVSTFNVYSPTGDNRRSLYGVERKENLGFTKGLVVLRPGDTIVRTEIDLTRKRLPRPGYCLTNIKGALEGGYYNAISKSSKVIPEFLVS